jgi:hypothetical protein
MLSKDLAKNIKRNFTRIAKEYEYNLSKYNLTYVCIT